MKVFKLTWRRDLSGPTVKGFFYSLRVKKMNDVQF